MMPRQWNTHQKIQDDKDEAVVREVFPDEDDLRHSYTDSQD